MFNAFLVPYLQRVLSAFVFKCEMTESSETPVLFMLRRFFFETSKEYNYFLGIKSQTTLFIQLPTVFEIIIKVSIPDIFTKCNTTVCFSILRNAYLIYACALIYYHQNLQLLELIQIYVSIKEAQRRYSMLRVEESETLLSSKLFVIIIRSYILNGTRLQTH